MSNNDNILKSLALLEQNLQDVTSAKDKVNSVVKSSNELAQVIESYKASFEGLTLNLQAVLSEVKTINIDTLSELNQQTKNFNLEVTKLTSINVSDTFHSIEQEVIKQFKIDLKEKLVVLDDETKKFNTEVSRLIEFDFNETFQTIRQKVVAQFEKDLKSRIVILDDKISDLEGKIEEFRTQISRIEKVDIESEFIKVLNVLKKQKNDQNEQHIAIKEEFEDYLVRFDQQEKEIKSTKYLLYLTVGLLAVVIILVLVFK